MNNTLSNGETLFADGKIEEAEKCFLSLVESDSECKEAYNNLGVIAFQTLMIKRKLSIISQERWK